MVADRQLMNISDILDRFGDLLGELRVEAGVLEDMAAHVPKIAHLAPYARHVQDLDALEKVTDALTAMIPGPLWDAIEKARQERAYAG
jgi:hypothetical protein